MSQRELRFRPTDPAEPDVAIRHNPNPAITIECLKQSIAKTEDKGLRQAWQEQIKQLEREIEDSKG